MEARHTAGQFVMRRVAPGVSVWRVITEGETVGSILHHDWGPEELRWQWSITITQVYRTAGHGTASSLVKAQSAFRDAWSRVRAEIGEAGWAHHVAHQRALETRLRFSEEVRRRRRRGDLSFPEW